MCDDTSSSASPSGALQGLAQNVPVHAVLALFISPGKGMSSGSKQGGKRQIRGESH